MTSPRVILFDVMDTLVVDPFRDEMPAFFGITFEEMMRAKDPHAWIEFECARIDEATFYERFFADGRRFDGAAFRAHVADAYRFVPGVPALLDALREARVPMHALSNYPCWYEIIEARLALSRHLSRRFVSFETGVRKPDVAAYLGAASALGVAPSECVFVDDRATNCEAASRVGMDTIVFSDAASLGDALTRRGILPRA